MKKHLLYLISLLLLLAISFNSFAQSNAGGKISAQDAKALKAMGKALLKGDFKAYTILKAGAGGTTQCLVPYVCASSAVIPLTANVAPDAWPAYKNIVWEARQATGLDINGGVIGVAYPLSQNVVTFDPITKWNFHPENVPPSDNGQFVEIIARLYNNLGVNFASFSDIVMYYKTPDVFAISSPDGSICSGKPYTVSLANSSAPVGPNYVIAGLMTKTAYILKKGGVSTGDTLIGTGGQLDYIVTQPGIYTIQAITVPATSILGPGDVCSTPMSGSTTVTVNPLPDINVATSNSPICDGDNLILTGSTGVVASSFVWADLNGWSAAGGNVVRNTVTTAQGGPYTLTATSTNFCVKDSVISVDVNPRPTVNLIGPTPVCLNVEKAYATTGGKTNYQWNTAELILNGATVESGGTVTDNTINLKWAASSGTKTVRVNYEEIGCSAAQPTSLDVVVNPLPVASISTTPALLTKGCTDVPIKFSTQPGMTNYTWGLGGGTVVAGGSSTDDYVTLSWATALPNPKFVTVTYTDPNTCSPAAAATYTITINDVPVPTISGPDPVCAGTQSQYTTESGPGISGWAWTVTGGTFDGGINNTPTVKVNWNSSTVDATGTLTVNYTNSNNCTAATLGSKTISLKAQPDISLSGPTPVCQGSIGNVYTTDGGMSLYTWSIQGGNITAGGTAGSNTATVKWNTTGPQWIKVNYTAANTCTTPNDKQFDVTVQALPTPVVNPTSPTSACIGVPVATQYTTQSGGGEKNYNWTIVGGAANGTIDSGQGTDKVNVTWLTGGTQKIKVTYENASSCAATSPDYSVTVNPLPVASLITPITTVCAGTATTYNTQPGMGVGKYFWTVTGGTFQGGISNTQSVTVNWNANTATTTQTLTVYYVNLNGCTSNTVSQLITVNGQPTITLTPVPNTPICQGDIRTYNTEVGMTLYNWNLSNGTITGGGGATDAFITIHWNIPTAAAKKVSVNYSNPSLCTATLPFEIVETVNALPIPTVAGPVTACIGVAGNEYSTQTGSGESGYSWTIVGGVANGTIDSGQGTDKVSVTWVSGGVQELYVKYKNLSGCMGTSKNYDVTVNAIPVPQLNLPAAPACEGWSSASYTTDAGMVPGNYNWSISPAVNGTITGQGTAAISVLWNTAGNADISVNYNNGCASTTTTKKVNVGAKPTPTLTYLPGSVCIGASKNYATDKLKTNYTWVVVGGNISTALPWTNKDNVDVTWVAGTTHSISVNYTEGGCEAPLATVFNETVLAVPTPTITGSVNECVGVQNITYKTESGAGEHGWTWSVSAGNNIQSGLGTDQITVEWLVPGNQTVSVNYLNAGNCTAAADVDKTVVVNAIPNPTITLVGPATSCLGSTQTYTTEASQFNYKWTVTNGTIQGVDNTNTVVVKWDVAIGAATVNVNYQDGIGCRPATAKSYGLNVDALPTINLTGSTSVCTGSTNTYNAPDPGNSGYIWNVTGFASKVGGDVGDNFVTVTWPATAGNGTVSLNYNNAAGCTAAAAVVKNITIGATSTPAINGLNLVCEGTQNVDYSTESAMDAGSYVWAVSGGGLITSVAPLTDKIKVDWPLGTSGNQTVSVNYTNPSGCPVVGPFVYNVNVSALPITEIITGPILSCINGSDTYSIGTGHSNIKWTVSANGTIHNGVDNLDNVTIDWNAIGVGTVSVTYTNSDNCGPLTPSTPLTTTVSALPLPIITSTFSTVCEGSTGVATYTTDPGMGTYLWNVTGGSIASGGSTNEIIVDWTIPGNGSVTVNYKNAGGCFAATPSTFNVAVTAKPLPQIVGSISACINNTVGDTYSTKQIGASNWFWTVTNGNIISGQSTDKVVVEWTSTTNTFLTVSYDENGCTGTSAPYNVVVNPLPTAKAAITSPLDGFYCSGSNGVDVLLNSPEANVTYELYDGSAIPVLQAAPTVSGGTISWKNILAGTYSIKGISATGCSSIVATNIVVQTHPLPSNVYSINPTGSVVGCNGGLGYDISINGAVSESGVSYQLLLDGLPKDLPILSVGGAIAFPLAQKGFGTYTILGTNSWGCTNVMSNSFVVVPDVVIAQYNVLSDPASGQFCADGTSGVDISLSPVSDNNLSYVLESSVADVETILSTGGPINFATVSPLTTETYRVKVVTATGCFDYMNNGITADPIAPPIAYPVTADNAGFYCNGDGGVKIHVSGQELGVVYDLYEDASPLVVASVTGVVNGPASELTFSGLFPTGHYSVTASRPLVAPCSKLMSNSVAVTENAAISVFNVTTSGDYCTGGTSDLTLSDTQVGAEYRWVTGTTSGAWTPSPVAGGPLVFVGLTADSYTVEARMIANGITCPKNMSGTAVIGVKPYPSDVSLLTSGGADCNDGIVITVVSSESGVSYSAIDQGSGVYLVPVIIGTGADISFPAIIDNGKTYIVEANRNGCTKIVGTPVTINIPGAVIQQTVTGGGTICSGGTATVGLANTEALTRYDLMLADSPGGPSSVAPVATMIGNGSPKDFSAAIGNGEYFVVATAGSCSNEMSNRVTVTLNPPVVADLSVLPAGTLCEGTSATFTATGGDTYTFYVNLVSQGTSAVNTFTSSTFANGDQVKVLVVNSVTTCSALTLPVTVAVESKIKKYNLFSVSNGIICPASTDTLYLDNSEIDVNYTLLDASNATVATVPGTNGVIFFTGVGVGTYTVSADRAGGSVCGAQIMNNSVTVGLATPPAVFNVSPTGTENGCLGGFITLDGNEVLTYNLVKNGTTILATQVGTGVALPALSFTKPLSAGLYSIEAVYGKGCKLGMNGTLQIDNPPTENTYDFVGTPANGYFCNDGVNPGVNLTLSNSDSGKTYSLFLGLSKVLDTLSIGGPINFGDFKTATSPLSYSVQVASSNGCFQDMNGEVIVRPNTPPSVLSVQATDNGFYCSVGGLGVGIQLVGQQTDVLYELSLSGSVVGTATGVVTDGSTPLPFINSSNSSYLFTAGGTYFVTAHNSTPNSCIIGMANSVVVSPTLAPASYSVTTSGDFCEGGSATINVNGSETTSLYRWVNLTTTDALSPWISGTGGLLQFSNITLPGDYMIEAKNNFGSPCFSVMADTVSVMVTKLPLQRNVSVKDGADCSSASLVIVENAENGVTYTIVDAASNVPTAIFFVGTTNLLDTMQIIDSNALYYIQAQRGACPVRIAPDFLIDNQGPPAAVKKHVVTPVDASICNGDAGVKFGLATNTAGVKYTLYWSVDAIVDAADQKVDSLVGNGVPNVQFKKLGKKQGKYYVVGISADKACRNFMSNEPQLVVNPLPLAYKMVGSGLYCNPDPLDSLSGAAISLEKQQDRTLYTLQQFDGAGLYIDDVVEFRGSLSGSPFTFGYFKEGAGVNLGHNTYNVVARDTLTGCTSNMDGSVLVKQTTSTPGKPSVNLGTSGGRYCSGTNGIDVLISSPEAGLTYQLFEQRAPLADTLIVSRVAATASPLSLGYYGVGQYYVNASWGGDACIQNSDPFAISLRLPLTFDVSYDCHALPTDSIISDGGYISLDSSEVGITYMVFDATNELVGFKNGRDTVLTFPGRYGAGKYTVQGTCSPTATPVSMNNGIEITFPYALYDLSIANRPSLTGIVGDTILQSGSDLGVNYYLRLNTWVDTFAVGLGNPTPPPPPLNFITDSAGYYQVMGIDSLHCATVNPTKVNILQSLLLAINDTLRFSSSDYSGAMNVGLNDLYDPAGVDKNVAFRLLNYGINNDPNDVKLDSITGAFSYIKQPTYFGKDSVRYALVNKDVPSRYDEAVIWIYIGNKKINGNSFLVPNAFSPNGDGINDYFVISSDYAYVSTESQLQVFNRWGSLVYTSTGKLYDSTWDGTGNSGMISIGSELPNGTYYYIYKVTFNVGASLQSDEYSGYIELRR